MRHQVALEGVSDCTSESGVEFAQLCACCMLEAKENACETSCTVRLLQSDYEDDTVSGHDGDHHRGKCGKSSKCGCKESET